MRQLACACGLLVLLAGFGGSGGADRVSVVVTSGAMTYTLRCAPASGTLPFAVRLCADIRAHPVAMLTPPTARSSCSAPAGHRLRVRTVANGVRAVFGDEC